jgi:hypothetical protein
MTHAVDDSQARPEDRRMFVFFLSFYEAVMSWKRMFLSSFTDR